MVGAVFGALFSDVVNRIAPGLDLDPTTCALVGMAAFFTAVVRAPLTGMLLVLGMTGTVHPLATMLAACAGAMIVPAMVDSPPIYDTLRERMLSRVPASGWQGDNWTSG